MNLVKCSDQNVHSLASFPPHLMPTDHQGPTSGGPTYPQEGIIWWLSETATLASPARVQAVPFLFVFPPNSNPSVA